MCEKACMYERMYVKCCNIYFVVEFICNIISTQQDHESIKGSMQAIMESKPQSSEIYRQ